MSVSTVLSSGTGVHGNDESTDDHSSADAADPVSSPAPGPAAATAGTDAPAGKMHTTPTQLGPGPRSACLNMPFFSR